MALVIPRRMVARARPEPVREAVERAEELLRLPEGWDSYGARPVSSRAVARAVAFLRCEASRVPRLPAPCIVPTARGGVQFEWRRRGIDVEIGFDAVGRPSWYAEDRETGSSVEAFLDDGEHAIRDWLVRVAN